MSAMLSRGVIAVALGLSLILGSMGAGPSASAEGPASLFYGYVSADTEGVLPDRVRALSVSGMVCGTAYVHPIATGRGFYALSVWSHEQKTGCPAAGAVVQFGLVADRIDDGQWADRTGMMWPGMSQRLDLAQSSTVFPGWSAGSEHSQSSVTLRWTGAPETRLQSALEQIPVPVVSTLRVGLDGFLSELSADDTLSPGDLIIIELP